MSKVALYTITSDLHNEVISEVAQESFIREITELRGEEFDIHGADFSSYGEAPLNLIYIRTGGTENAFKAVFPKLDGPVRLLASGKSNSLAASMEILSFLNQQGREGEIIHGSAEYIAKRVNILKNVCSARHKLNGTRLGVVGKPSDWLISSDPDRDAVKAGLGIELVDIPMKELLKEIEKKEYSLPAGLELSRDYDHNTMEVALHIYGALKRLIAKYKLSGLTVRCFDLLGPICNTGCLALAILNSEGIPAGCEGDIPTLLSMVVTNALTGVSGFQANPSRINPESGEIVFAHCTIPLNMVESYRYDTHFESGLGVAIKGEFPVGDVTIFKLSGDLRRHFAVDAALVTNLNEKNLCRTQILVKAPGTADYFLKHSIGNHHVIIPGHHAAEINDLLATVSNSADRACLHQSDGE